MDFERNSIRKELSSLSFEELQNLKDEIGTKLYKKALQGPATSKLSGKKRSDDTEPVPIPCRKSKDSPLELPFKKSIKTALPQHVQIPATKFRGRDPRFDSSSGSYDKEKFQKAYNFIDGMRADEKHLLQQELEKEEDTERRSKIKFCLQRIKNQERETKREQKKAEIKKKVKQDKIERSNQGKKPFYLKKTVQRQSELAERYEQLKKEGRLDKYIEKKRKHNASKEKKSVLF